MKRKRSWIFRWESNDTHFPGAYYSESTRTPQFWMVLNRFNENCWCGKPKKMFGKGRRKHCSSRCANIWSEGMRCTWKMTREMILRNSDYKCKICGNNDYNMEVDHIIARCLGGEIWGSWNLRALCRKCHVEKTKEDLAKLKLLKKNSDF